VSFCFSASQRKAKKKNQKLCDLCGEKFFIEDPFRVTIMPPIPQEYKMLTYQLKIEIKPYKPDEFVNSMRSYLHRIRKAKGCVDFSVYQDSDKENTYIVVGEWQTRQAMEKHFQTKEFELLIGAARVLGE